MNWLINNLRGYITITLLIWAVWAAIGLCKSVAHSVRLIRKGERDEEVDNH